MLPKDEDVRSLREKLKMPREKIIAEYGSAVTDEAALAAISSSNLDSGALLSLFHTIEKAKGQPQKLSFVFKFLRENRFGEVEAFIVGAEEFKLHAKASFQVFLNLYKAFNYLETPSYNLAIFSSLAVHFSGLKQLFLSTLFALAQKRFTSETLTDFYSIYLPTIGYMPRDLKEKCLLALISSAKKGDSLFDIIHSINKVILKGRYQTVLENIAESERVLNAARNFISGLEKTILSGKEFLCAIEGSAPLRMTHSTSDADLVIMVVGIPYDRSIEHAIDDSSSRPILSTHTRIDVHTRFFPDLDNITAENFFTSRIEKDEKESVVRFVVPYEVLKGDPKLVKKIFDAAFKIYKKIPGATPILFWKQKYVGRNSRDPLIVTKPTD